MDCHPSAQWAVEVDSRRRFACNRDRSRIGTSRGWRVPKFDSPHRQDPAAKSTSGRPRRRGGKFPCPAALIVAGGSNGAKPMRCLEHDAASTAVLSSTSFPPRMGVSGCAASSSISRCGRGGSRWSIRGRRGSARKVAEKTAGRPANHRIAQHAFSSAQIRVLPRLSQTRLPQSI